jgi:hypothetical protein
MITDVNPFVYSRPIAPDQVVDRDEETKLLLKNAVGGHYVRLYAPRKYGKTSLLQRALADGERQEGLVPVLVDLYGIVSIADVAVRFERAYAQELRGAIRSRVEEFLQKTGLGLSLGAFGISARLQLQPKTSPLPALHALLDLPLRLEESGGFRAYIALDEFQDVRKVPDLDGILRSHIQFQGDVASYVFAGSEPGLMKQLFEHKEAPLYGSAVPVRLGRLRDEDLAEYVADRFRESKRAVGEALNPLLASAKGPPAAGDAARPPALGGGRAEGQRDARGVGARARRGAPRAAAGVRGAVARARHLRAEDAARDHRRRRLALPGSGARAARAEQDECAEGPAAAELPRRDRSRGSQAGDRRSALRRVDRGAGLVAERAFEAGDRLALDACVASTRP